MRTIENKLPLSLFSMRAGIGTFLIGYVLSALPQSLRSEIGEAAAKIAAFKEPTDPGALVAFGPLPVESPVGAEFLPWSVVAFADGSRFVAPACQACGGAALLVKTAGKSEDGAATMRKAPCERAHKALTAGTAGSMRCCASAATRRCARRRWRCAAGCCGHRATA